MSTKIVIEKSFREWTRKDLKDYVGLIPTEQSTALNNWLEMEVEITKTEKTFLQQLLKKGRKHIDFWNEMELRTKFILELTRLVSFEDDKYELYSFAERSIAFTSQQKIFKAKLTGVVDWMVAIGEDVPESPFFFIHEYKAEEGRTQDGKGQLLAAMYVAQQLNLQPPQPTLFNPTPIHFYKTIPIYGAYVKGKDWTFLVLEGNKYQLSTPFVSTKENDLQAIFRILKAQKQIIYNLIRRKI